jgi:hypothetical protein
MPLLEGVTSSGKKKAIRLTDNGDINVEIQTNNNESVSQGTAPDDVSGPTSGSGYLKWLGGIWDLINKILSRFPEKTAAGKIPVDVSFPSGQVAATFISSTTTGDIAAGHTAVSVFNFGNAAGILLGSSLPSGASVSFSAPEGKTLAAISFNATGTQFLITGVQ